MLSSAGLEIGFATALLLTVLLVYVSRRAEGRNWLYYGALGVSGISFGAFFDFGSTIIEKRLAQGLFHPLVWGVLLGGTVYYFCALRARKKRGS